MITRREMVDVAWEFVADAYHAGTSLDVLAKRHKISRHSLTHGLKLRGYFVDGRKNKPKLDRCKRDHDMAIHGRQLYTATGRKNGRECTECKRERQRVT